MQRWEKHILDEEKVVRRCWYRPLDVEQESLERPLVNDACLHFDAIGLGLSTVHIFAIRGRLGSCGSKLRVNGKTGVRQVFHSSEAAVVWLQYVAVLHFRLQAYRQFVTPKAERSVVLTQRILVTSFEMICSFH